MAKMIAVHPLEQFLETLKPVEGKGVTVEPLVSRGIAHVFAAKGKTKTVERVLKIKESPGKASKTEKATALPLSPGQWLLVSNRANTSGNFANDLRKPLKNNGYVSEQSDGRVIFRLSGSKVVDLLQKGCRLDLHPDVTGPGWCAQTQIAQIGVIIHQVDAKPTYDILVYSGFARDFAEWLHHTGAQLEIGFKH